MLDTNKKFINTKVIETRNCDRASVQALRTETERVVELSKLHRGHRHRQWRPVCDLLASVHLGRPRDAVLGRSRTLRLIASGKP